MATPSDPREDSDSPSLSEYLEKTFDDSSLRKQNSESFEDNPDDAIWDFTDDGRPKTRRVNPQRLAIRLGPDLVAEMEALIVPGAKMPTFTVRKDLQERYSVDRRHIYDYFHSRGLRVAKEDKHTNLIRGRAMKAQAQLQVAKAPRSTMEIEGTLGDSSSHPTTPTVEKESSALESLPSQPYLFLDEESVTCDKPPSQLHLTVQAQTLSESAQNPKKRSLMPKPVSQARIATKRKLNAKESKLPAKRRAIAPKTKKILCIAGSLVPRASGGETSSDEMGIVASPSGTDTDSDLTAPCPQFSLPCDTSEDYAEASSPMSMFLPSPDDFMVEYFDSPLSIQQHSETTGRDFYVDDHRVLTEGERTDLYNLINSNIPDALEESAGTYTNYMHERSRSYFDCLLPVSRSTRPRKLINKPEISDFSVTADLPDVRKWLADETCQPIMRAYDYHPIRDTFVGNDLFGDLPPLVGFRPNGAAYYGGLRPLHAQNRPFLRDVENAATASKQGSENINPNTA